MSALREVFAQFGFDFIGQDKVKSADKDVSSLTDKVQKLGRALSAGLIAYGFKKFVDSQVDAARQTFFMAERLGMSTDELQRWQFIAEAAGETTQDLGIAVRFLYRNIGEAERGQKGANKLFAEMGVNFKDATGKVKPITEVMGDIADKFQKMPDQAKRVDYAVKLFGRNGAKLLQILQNGRKGFAQYSEAFDEIGGGVSQENLGKITMFGLQMIKLEHIWKRVTSEMMVGFLPVLEKITIWLSKGARYLEDLSHRTQMWKTGILFLGGAFTILAAAIAAPYAWIFGLYLLFDDLFALFSGGNSITGEFIDKLYGVGRAQEAVGNLKKSFEGLNEEVGFNLTSIEDLANYTLLMFGQVLPAAADVYEALVVDITSGYVIMKGAIQEINVGLQHLHNFVNTQKEGQGEREADLYNKQVEVDKSREFLQDLRDRRAALEDHYNSLGDIASPRKDEYGNWTVGGKPTNANPRTDWVTPQGPARGGDTLHIEVHGAGDPQETARLVTTTGRALLAEKAAQEARLRNTYGAVGPMAATP